MKALSDDRFARSAPAPFVIRRQVEAVTFDFWETLVLTNNAGTRSARAAAIHEALGRYGYNIDGDALELAFEHCFGLFNEAWRDNRQFTARDAGEIVLERLAAGIVGEAREAGIAAFAEGAAGIDVRLADHVEETLIALKEREIRLGIICDVGLTPSPALRGYLAAHGVLDLFDYWSFSDEVGAYKPDRRIFEHALAGLGGIEVARAVHVGDLRRTDVAGSKSMGMTSVRYRGAFDDPAVANALEGDHVIDDHADLLAVLGLA